MDIAELWDITLSFFYDNKKEFVNEFSAFLKTKKVKSVLDCSCGTGFPSIDLKKKGFNIHCADSNDSMIRMFNKNVAERKVVIPFTKSKWQDLSRNIDKKFDCVMCRGNSFIYINSWGKDRFSPRGIKEQMLKALCNFYELTADDGIFYIDIPDKREYTNGTVFFSRFDKKRINGCEVSLIWDIKHYPKKRLRKVNAQLFKWNKNKIVSRKQKELFAYLLYPHELDKLMRQAGFKNIKPLKLKSETNYTPFIATK